MVTVSAVPWNVTLPPTVFKFVKILSNCAPDNLQLATVKLYLNPVAFIEVNDGQLLNILLNEAVDSIPLKLIAGTAANDAHPLNIPFMLLSTGVLNLGTEVKLTQALNILFAFVTFDKSNKGTCCSDWQLVNMLLVVVDSEVLINGTEDKA